MEQVCQRERNCIKETYLCARDKKQLIGWVGKSGVKRVTQSRNHFSVISFFMQE